MSGRIKRPVLCGYVLLFGLVFTHTPGWAQTCSLRVHFIDAGCGDAVLLELPDATTVLVDAGPAEHSSRLLTYLKTNHVRRIDTAVITHPHQNHFAGFRKIAGRIPIGRLFHNGDPEGEEGYAALLAYLGRRHVPVDVLRRGQKLEQLPESITMEVLNPPDLGGSPNDNSIVLWLKHGRVSILFLADIGPDRQDALLASFPDIRQADCVHLPHHGGPMNDAFIEAFRGKAFIVSTGPNRWGLPREEELEKLEGKIYRTDRHGTIVAESDGNLLKITSWTARD